MKTYKPDLTRQKRRYSLLLRLRKNRKKTQLPAIPDNRVPWGPAPRTLKEAIALSDRIARARSSLRKA
ncbi:MAG: hypothetical protein M3463_17305 [Verrucomicrobiota bacterium]|nr:hypothetical protein [Verrucomicrobiota bacterium]